jgi:hypothetical protein
LIDDKHNTEEGCSNKRKQYTEEDFMQVMEEEYPDSDFDEANFSSTLILNNAFHTSFVSFKTFFHFLLSMSLNQEEDDLRHAKLMKKFQKYVDAAIAARKKANSDTNIDRPVPTDMGSGDQPKKIRGKKKKNQKV